MGAASTSGLTRSAQAARWPRAAAMAESSTPSSSLSRLNWPIPASSPRDQLAAGLADAGKHDVVGAHPGRQRARPAHRPRPRRRHSPSRCSTLSTARLGLALTAKAMWTRGKPGQRRRETPAHGAPAWRANRHRPACPPPRRSRAAARPRRAARRRGIRNGPFSGSASRRLPEADRTDRRRVPPNACAVRHCVRERLAANEPAGLRPRDGLRAPTVRAAAAPRLRA